LKKLQRIHKSIVWNFIIGRSYVDRISKSKLPSEEINLDHDENLEFDPKNPRVRKILVSNYMCTKFPFSSLKTFPTNFSKVPDVKI